jgi:hypothetical protein
MLELLCPGEVPGSGESRGNERSVSGLPFLNAVHIHTCFCNLPGEELRLVIIQGEVGRE